MAAKKPMFGPKRARSAIEQLETTGNVDWAEAHHEWLHSERRAEKETSRRPRPGECVHIYEDGRQLHMPVRCDYPDTYDGLRAYHEAMTAFDGEVARLHNIQFRQGWAEGERYHEWLTKRLAAMARGAPVKAAQRTWRWGR